MSDGNFAQQIQSERERLTRERETIRSQQRELEQKLTAIDREFQAIEAYEAAKTGKAVRGGMASSGRTRARRGSKREALMELIKSAAGLSRADILAKMGLKGDKSGEMSVSNALTALTKANQVRRDGGKYHAA
jgi:Fe2+ or Zn2+ uptake regulation protein